MQKFKIIGKRLLEEKYVEGKKKNKNNAITSALARMHNVRAHALRSDQKQNENISQKTSQQVKTKDKWLSKPSLIHCSF